MEAQPVLVLASRDSASSKGSGALIIKHGGERFAVIVTGMGTRNAEAKAGVALVLLFAISLTYYRVVRPTRSAPFRGAILWPSATALG
jgi:hypothetical protein